MQIHATAFKTCKVCGETKPLAAFYRCRGYKDGHGRTCIACEKAYKRRPEVMAKARETAVRSHGRKMARRRGVPATLTQEQWASALAYFGGCTYCGSTEGTMHMDHFIPEWRGGAFTADNIVPACASCNYKKHQRLPEDWCHPETYDRVIVYFASLDLTPNGNRPLREPKGYATGDLHGSRLHPERLARGENHYLRKNPEMIRRGQDTGHAKLTDEQVIEIFTRYRAGGISQSQLAREYGVSQHLVCKIHRGVVWGHLTKSISSEEIDKFRQKLH